MGLVVDCSGGMGDRVGLGDDGRKLGCGPDAAGRDSDGTGELPSGRVWGATSGDAGLDGGSEGGW